MSHKNRFVLSLNLEDNYFELNSNNTSDVTNGCVIVADSVIDVAVDVYVDVVTDVVADAVADTLADAAADAAADIAADAAADAVGDAAADTMVDAVANGGVSTISKNVLKDIGLKIGKAILGAIVTAAVGAIENAIKKAGSTKDTSSADYWDSLYDNMTKVIPCDLPATEFCGKDQRDGQQAMILAFQANIANGSPDAQKAAINFETIFTAKQQNALKLELVNISKTGGIPSMVKHMSTYTNPGASGAPLVIATSNVLIAVTDFVFSGQALESLFGFWPSGRKDDNFVLSQPAKWEFNELNDHFEGEDKGEISSLPANC